MVAVGLMIIQCDHQPHKRIYGGPQLQVPTLVRRG